MQLSIISKMSERLEAALAQATSVKFVLTRNFEAWTFWLNSMTISELVAVAALDSSWYYYGKYNTNYTDDLFSVCLR